MTESSETRRNAIRLGRELVEQLSSRERADTLSRWIAYYIAEQISLASSASGPEKIAAEERCFSSILRLWEHRNSLPDGLRPFEGFEPILRTLAQLDPENPKSVYHGAIRRDELTEEPSEISKLVDLVFALDRGTRILIEFLIGEATSRAMQPGVKDILEHVFETDVKGDIEAIRELKRRSNRLALEGVKRSEAIETMGERLEELRRLGEMCRSVSDQLEEEIGDTQ
ncbi:MAG: hypothetical protein AAF591_00685 [Verrucomicrobiota bacterium]